MTMPTPCRVLGDIRTIGLAPAAGVVLHITPEPAKTHRAGDAVIVPEPMIVTVSEAGDIDISLVPGRYTISARQGSSVYGRVLITVPSANLAYLAQLLDAPPPPNLTAAQLAVSDAQAARDAANASAVAADADRVAAEAASVAAAAARDAAAGSEGAVATSAAQATASASAALSAASSSDASAIAAASSAVTASTQAGLAATARSGAETARDAAAGSQTAAGASATVAAGWATAAGTAKTGAETARDAAVDARTAAEAANDQAQAASNIHEAVAGNVGTLMAAFGQAWEELQKVMDGQDDNALTSVHVLNLAQILGQISDQVNGGRISLVGGTLADPAIRIGTVGIYSSAANTLSVAISGVERLRVTASGITVYGTVTNA